MPLSTSPLFRHATAAMKNAALAEFRSTDIGKLVSQAQSARRSGAMKYAKFRKMLNNWDSFGTNDAMRELQNTSMGRLVRDVQKYGKGGNANFLQAFLKELGPAGQILQALGKSLSTPAGISRELSAAANLLRAFGYEVLPAKGATATAAEVNRGAQAARQFLEQLGYTVVPPGQADVAGGEMQTVRPVDTLPFGIDDQTKSGRKRKQVTLPTDRGNKRFPVNHPIVTGEMVRTPGSSNVYAYGYNIEEGALYVRFRANAAPGSKGKKPNAPGSLYRYSNVPERIFLSMLRAPSKGVFIWDNIRIRGTLSGHRYDYQLTGITGGYVPRKATMTPKGESYIRRTIRDPSNPHRMLESQLSNQLIRPLVPGAPNRGVPNRGTPNRGR